MYHLFLMLWSALALAAEPELCSSPRQSISTLLDNLQPERYNPELAASCIPTDNGAEIGIKIQRVLDAKGIYVSYDKLPDSPDFQTEDNTAFVYYDAIPSVSVVKKDGQWLFSDSTIQAVPKLYTETFSTNISAFVNTLPPTFQAHIGGFYVWQGVFLLILTLLAVLVGRLVDFILIRQFLTYATKLKIKLNPELIAHMRQPLIAVSIGATLFFGTPELQLSVRPSQTLLVISKAIISISIVVIVSRIIDILSSVFSEKAALTDSKFDDQIIPLVTRASKLFVWVFGIIFILQNLGIEVTALVALGSVSGVAIALASKDTVENLFGSVVVFIDQPFQIGDWVVIDGSIEGIVEEVGFRSTRIRTFVTSLVSVPNAKIANSTVDNFGRREFRRYKANLGFRYDSKSEDIMNFIKDIKAYLEGHQYTVAGRTYVYFSNMGPHSLDVMVMTFLNMDDYSVEMETKQAFHLKFMTLAEEHHLGFAFPTQTLEVESPKPIQIHKGDQTPRSS